MLVSRELEDIRMLGTIRAREVARDENVSLHVVVADVPTRCLARLPLDLTHAFHLPHHLEEFIRSRSVIRMKFDETTTGFSIELPTSFSIREPA